MMQPHRRRTIGRIGAVVAALAACSCSTLSRQGARLYPPRADADSLASATEWWTYENVRYGVRFRVPDHFEGWSAAPQRPALATVLVHHRDASRLELTDQRERQAPVGLGFAAHEGSSESVCRDERALRACRRESVMFRGAAAVAFSCQTGDPDGPERSLSPKAGICLSRQGRTYDFVLRASSSAPVHQRHLDTFYRVLRTVEFPASPPAAWRPAVQGLARLADE